MTTKNQRMLKRLSRTCLGCSKLLPTYLRKRGHQHCNGDVCMVAVFVG